jgi:hypothetical protein
MSAQESLYTRQAYLTQKRERKSPDIAGEDRSPDFPIVLNLDGNFISAERHLEHEEKSALSRFGQIGVGGRD